MNSWLQGKRRGLIVYLAIAGLVIGGLGWVTFAALRLESEQQEAQAKGERDSRINLAMWRLHSRLAPAFAREESRPYNHYSAISAPSLAISKDGLALKPGSVLEPSPLLNADLPDWMLLHFQTDVKGGWASPQVLTESLRQRLANKAVGASLLNATPERANLLAGLSRQAPSAKTLLADVRQRSADRSVKDTAMLLAPNANENVTSANQGPAANSAYPGRGANSGDYDNRISQQARVQREFTSNSITLNDRTTALVNLECNGENWLMPSSRARLQGVPVEIYVGSMVPLWLASPGGEQLLLVRLVRIDAKEISQGIVLDLPKLQAVLTEEVTDLFPGARILPVHENDEVNAEQVMTALPLKLDPGELPLAALETGWTPLRIGLILAWLAALAALLAVGLGGWSLIDLSERRIRFVSAVTHELRTPLTTLRLYLDMLTGGMVKDEKQRDEYLHTLNGETDRLNRLVANVLDFSRLENQKPQLHKSEVAIVALLEGIKATWQGRCHDSAKELIVESQVGEAWHVVIDRQLVQQILGNLIDNACKYSRSAEDRRLWVRARQGTSSSLILEVEDRVPV